MRYHWDDFVLDTDSFRLERAGIALAIEPKAFNLLALMIQRPGHVFTKQEIFDVVWAETVVTDHALTRVVAQLRRLLGDDARDGRYIETIPTRGYRWLPHVRTVDVSAEASTVAAEEGVARLTIRSIWPSARFAAVALGGAMAVVGLVAWSQRADSNESVPVARPVYWPVQLTTNSGLDLHPAFSPRGEAVAYASDRSGAFEIYVRTLADQATETALTDNGGHNVQPAWSPDGRLIAFHSHVVGGIWMVPARGGVAKQLAPQGSNPAWSPDGRLIAFQSDEPADVTPSAFGAQSGSTIWTVDVESLTLRKLTDAGHPLGGHATPAFSNDGRYLAFTVFDGDSNGIWLLTLETLATSQLQHGRGLYELVFAPDDSVLYAAGGEPLISRLRFDRSTGTVLGDREVMPIPGVAGVRGLTISSDGARLAFAGLDLTSQIWRQPIGPDGSPKGEARAVTTDTSRRNSLPAISPDGTRIAYDSRRGGETPNVWVIDVDGTNALQATSSQSADTKPQWFPNGRRLAFVSERQNVEGLWAVDLTTRREELLFDFARFDRSHVGDRARLRELALDPSISRVAFSVIVPPEAHRQLHLTTLKSLESRRLTDGAEWIGYPAWSPDERQLAVEIKEGSTTHAGIIDVSSGKVRRLTNERGQTWVRSWSPDGKKIAAAAFRNGRWDLRWLDAASGEHGIITPATPPRVYMRYPEWSPRGDVVVFERGELRGNIWTLPLGSDSTNSSAHTTTTRQHP